MRNILSKIYFHPIFLVTVLIFILIGKFRFISYFMLLIIIHELGHIVTSMCFNWNIDKIIILPFGGLTKYNEIINRPLKEELIVAIMGVIVQMIFYLLIKDRIDYKYFSLINYFIIIFNLIPIYPLDGSKILNVFFNKITSFKNSLLLTIIVSYILIILLSIILLKFNKLILLVISSLLIEVNKMYKNRKLIFNKFLLERYLGEFKFKKEKTINNIDNMKRDYRHVFYILGRYYTEKFFLRKMFDIKGKMWYYFKRVGPLPTTTQKRFKTFMYLNGES